MRPTGLLLSAAISVAAASLWPSAAVAATDTHAVQGAKASARGWNPKSSPYRPTRLTQQAKNHYLAAWGVDKLKVSHTASGNLIRFSYRVVDPARAKQLTDKNATPYLVGQKNRAVLQVPVMDKVGQLRQSGSAKSGQEYWMVFSNKGNMVRPGDKVNVLIGTFRAEGLMVE